jgi:hypothetical protein
MSAKEVIEGLIGILDKDAKEIISMLLVLAAFMSLGFVPIYLRNQASTGCWDVKEISGVPVKLNKCTGEVQRLNLSASQAR